MDYGKLGLLVALGSGAALGINGCGGNVNRVGESCLDGGVCPSGSACNAQGRCVSAGSGGASGGGVGGSGVGGSGVGGSGVGGSGVGGSGVGGSGVGGSGIGGSGIGGSTGSADLGRACATDAECGAGLFCMTAKFTELDGGGPAKGLCTTKCLAAGGQCELFDPSAFCRLVSGGAGYCLEGCAFGPPNLQAFDPGKCHGRPEVACAPAMDASGQIQGACTPTCNGDSDCGAGLFCHASDGLCRANPPLGKVVGEACQTPDAGGGECQGTCLPIQDGSGTSTNVCSANCTLGALPSCGWEGPTSGLPAPAGCVYVPSAVLDNGGAGVGDLGHCGRFCNCNGDCAPGLVCSAFGNSQVESFYQKNGYCAPSDEGPGIACN